MTQIKENTGSRTALCPSFLEDADFCLRCRGDSMLDARIQDGDLVYIHSQSEVENGQLAAVSIGGETWLRFVFRHPDRMILRAANPIYQDLELEGEDVQRAEILGLAVGFTSGLNGVKLFDVDEAAEEYQEHIEDWFTRILKYLKRATSEQLELIWLAVVHMVR